MAMPLLHLLEKNVITTILRDEPEKDFDPSHFQKPVKPYHGDEANDGFTHLIGTLRECVQQFSHIISSGNLKQKTAICGTHHPLFENGWLFLHSYA